MKKIVAVSTLALLLAGCNPGDQEAQDNSKTEQANKSADEKATSDNEKSDAEVAKEKEAKEAAEAKKEAEAKAEAEKKAEEQAAADKKTADEKAAEEKAAADKSAEDKTTEEKSSDASSTEDKAEDKSTDKKEDGKTDSAQDPEPAKPSKPESETPDVDKSDTKADLSLDLLVVVNKKYSLPIDYKPSDLVVPNVSFSYSGVLEQSYMRAPAAKQMEKMFADAKADGVTLNAVSGFRSGSRQTVLYNNYVARDGKAAADQYSARPGHSEHQTGLVFDISAPSVGNGLTAELGDTKEGKWIANNAAKYGFIVRYDRGFQSRTGYTYEPWHIRYVGVGPATQIKNNGQTLEEYMKVGH
ncbi:M15 family metallopeptidase [Exiguobacterium sp. K1]|uniref:M15 family metallopeptidase n=1 Tax=Exiguobacterium sp. K1 TaxID=2980105 RepID=UPI00299EE7B3|nr:M15 family metallopeptidase [Exiguobacterium sp. K1]MDX1260830.1 M15 family metallopeptidase [Exiguobacterium sp. K1]